MSLEESLRGKRILVTGAGRGIGKAVVERLHKYGAIVYALSRNPSNLEALKKQLPNIHTIAVNLEDWDATRASVEAIDNLDGVINNAGIYIPENFLDIRPESFDQLYATNLKAIINVSQVVAKKMIAEGKGGSIVNISSIAGNKIVGKGSLYCSSKGAIDIMTQCMAVELGPHKIRVNGIGPGFYETDLVMDTFVPAVMGGCREALLAELDLKMPMGGAFLNMEYLVNSILFVLSDLSLETNGHKLIVDGGYLCT